MKRLPGLVSELMINKKDIANSADLQKIYTAQVVDHASHPRNTGQLTNADAHSEMIGACGDKMEMWLKIINNRIIKINFWTDGCGTTIACGSAATELVRDKTVNEALVINAETIIEYLGNLPEEDIHCAGLASSTLKKAIIQYINIKKEPWKKNYEQKKWI